MDFDGYCELSSDDEDNAICCSHHYSSESNSDDDDEELSTILQYSANRTKHQGLFGATNDSTETDPFEEELAGELDQAMLKLRALDGSTASPSGPSTAASCPILPGFGSSGSNTKPIPNETSKSHYDSIYFDSDEDDEDEGVQNRRATQSDADLLYDPSLDDQDQQWMDDHRAAAHRTGLKRRDRNNCSGPKSQKRKQQQTKPGKNSALPDSDAILNCPGCLTMLCADCQRHAIYNTQFRAMFVFSCKVDYTQLLRFPTKLTKKEIWKNKKIERKMRQAMKKNEKDGNGSVEKSGIESAAPLIEETLPKKAQTDAAVEMECNNSSCIPKSSEDGGGSKETKCNSSSDHAPNRSGDSSNENGTFRDGEPDKESKSTDIISNEETLIQKESNCLPVKKVRFNTNEQDGEEGMKNKTDSESSCSSTLASGSSSTALGGSGLHQSDDEEMFHPVMCQHCNTKVAVLDKEEVYHFFNVITSY